MKRIPRPSPASAVALVVLFFALGGTALAAKHYLITSTGQIKPSVLSKLRGNTGPAGPVGPQGTQGPAGPSNLSRSSKSPGPRIRYRLKKSRALSPPVLPAHMWSAAETLCSPAKWGVSTGGTASIVVCDRGECQLIWRRFRPGRRLLRHRRPGRVGE